MAKARNWMTAIVALSVLTSAPAAHATRPADVPAIGTAAPATAIWSTAKGALPEPRDWNCDIVRPEYNDWLRAGNRARDWRHVGKLYRADSTGEYYTWNDWQEWSRTTRCGAWAMLPADRESLGAAIWITGMIILLVRLGGGPDSPG